MRAEYRVLLARIAQEITFKELETMKFLSTDFIPYTKLQVSTSEQDILTEVFNFFCKLEEQVKLGIDDLDWMKEMLTHVKREDLVLQVTVFQFQRELYRSSLSASEGESETKNQTTQSQQEENQEPAVKNQTNKGTIVMRCIPYIPGGLWLGGSVYLLNRYKDDPEVLMKIVAGVVLPIGTIVKSVFAGSINFLLQATDLNSLKELWKRYQTGQLKEDLQKVLVTEKLKNLANGEPIDLEVQMSEEEYRNACLDLMVAQIKAQTVYKGIMSTEPVLQASRSLPDLMLLDTTHELSRGLPFAQLYDDAKRRQNIRNVEKLPSNLLFSAENVFSLLQLIRSIQSEIDSLERRYVHEYKDRLDLCLLDSRSTEDDHFQTLLYKVNHYIKNGRFLFQPEAALKRLLSFAFRLEHSANAVHMDIQSSPLGFHRRSIVKREPYRLKECTTALKRDLKEMAALLVEIFRLDPGLLKAKPKYSAYSSSDDDDDDDEDLFKRVKRPKSSSPSSEKLFEMASMKRGENKEPRESDDDSCDPAYSF